MTTLSVCIATYNRIKLLRKTINSILSQSLDDIEIIVINDASSDGTEELLEQMRKQNKPAFRYLSHNRNKGLAEARNTGIKNAAGKWFAFCDDDDQWPPDFAEKMLATIKESSCFDVILGFPHPFSQDFLPSLPNPPSLRDIMYLGLTPPVAAQFYKTSMLKKIGGYNRKIISGVDHDLWINLVATQNPNVKLADEIEPIIGNDLQRERMTTHEEKRRKGIRNSLKIWRPTIIHGLGQKFYEYFYMSYLEYLDINFFKKSLKNRDFIDATKRLQSPAVRRFVLKKVTTKGKKSDPPGTFPPYKP